MGSFLRFREGVPSSNLSVCFADKAGLRLPASAAHCARLAGRCPNSDSLLPPLAAVLLPWFVRLVELISPKGPELEVISRQIANAHTAFNVCCALLWLPFLPWMVRLVCALVPEKEKK